MTDPALVEKKLALVYDDVDLSVVRDVLGNHLVDFEEFVAAIRQHVR
jgi:uncharacterized protein YutE (UPF0331/DUF86 family)